MQATLATKAANVEIAISSALRGDRDEWVRGALEQGLEACTELLAGVNAKPGVVNFFSHPETHEGLQFLRQELPSRTDQRQRLEEIRDALKAILSSDCQIPQALREKAEELQDFFEALSRQITSDDEIERRLSAEV